MATALPNTTVTLLPKQQLSLKVQTGQHYQVRKPGTPDTPPDGQAPGVQPPDALIATRQGDSLQVRYADGSVVQFEDFYTVCKDASTCSVTLASDSQAGITLAGDAAAGSVGADNGTLVYAHGSQDVLMAMAQGQAEALDTLGSLGDAPVLTYLPSAEHAAATESGLALVASVAALLVGKEAINQILDTGFHAGQTPVPTVTSLALGTTTGAQNKTLNAGDTVNIAVAMSEATFVAGSPTLTLHIGSSTVQAHYLSGSGSNMLLFSYTIQPGQNDANGISIDANSLSLNGGTLKGLAGTDATLTHSAVADNADYLVDTTAPTLTISSDMGSLHAGATAHITFSFSEDPGASFSDSSITSTGGLLGAISGSGLTRTATFTPPANLASGTASITVAADSYTDAAGNLGAAGNTATISLDTVAPTVSSVVFSGATGAVNNTLNAGDVVFATVNLSEATTVTGTPTLGLHIGNNVVQAHYVSGSKTQALLFSYTILAGQTDANGIGIDADSLALAGGTLQDAAGNDASLHHSAVADDASYLVNTDPPASALLALAFDTGTSSTDHVTNNAALVVTGALGSNRYATGNILTTNGNGNTAVIPVQTSDLVWDATDGNFASPVTLPATSTDGVRVHMQSVATFTYVVGTANTNLGAALPVPKFATADFVFSAAQGQWIYEGSVGYLGVQYSVDGGTYSAGYIAPTSQGAHTVLVTQTDAIGNVSAPTSYSFTLDTLAPTQTASIASYTDNAGTGSDGTFGSGTSTDDTTPVLNGTLSGAIASNDVVRIFDAGTLLGLATVAGTSWTFATPTLTDGSVHSYTAAVMDAAGNAGAASGAFALTVSSPFERLTNATITGSATGWTLNAAGSTIHYASDSIQFNDSNSPAGASAYQVLTQLVVGKSYTVQYELGELGVAGQHTMLAAVQDGAVWNAGTQLASQSYDQTDLTTTLHSFTFTPTSSTATLVFTNTALVSSVNTDLTLNQASVMTTDEAARHAATPLVLDLNGDGVQTVDVAHGVLFDVANTGVANHSAWVSNTDGLLVRDINQDGRINNGAELLGQGTLLADGTHAANGFAALAQFDGNHDGKIDAQDAVFKELKVWRDANGDGVSQAGELHGLADLGIVSFNLNATTGYAVENGNLHGLVSSFTTADGTVHAMADVWLQQSAAVVDTTHPLSYVALPVL